MIPYLQQLQDSIDEQKKLLSLLELKVKLLGGAVKEETLESVDKQISYIKIKNELSSLKKVIDEKESYFKKYAIEFEKDWEEVEKNFSQLFSKAKASNNPAVKDLLQRINYEILQREPQQKVYIYKVLKKLLK
jgi:hypothetical protein